MKSEPDDFSWDDLLKSKDQTTPWTGVRNYQARNIMRDQMKVGDGVLFYHSNAKPQDIPGLAVVASEPFPDPTQFEKKSKYFDPNSTLDAPRWMCVDVRADAIFEREVTRDALKENEALAEMMVLQKGARLSVQPVSSEHWKIIRKMGRPKKIHAD
ncbi:MAG: EVE domain-containing protein [Myxococcota bacterium]